MTYELVANPNYEKYLKRLAYYIAHPRWDKCIVSIIGAISLYYNGKYWIREYYKNILARHLHRQFPKLSYNKSEYYSIYKITDGTLSDIWFLVYYFITIPYSTENFVNIIDKLGICVKDPLALKGIPVTNGYLADGRISTRLRLNYFRLRISVPDNFKSAEAPLYFREVFAGKYELVRRYFINHIMRRYKITAVICFQHEPTSFRNIMNHVFIGSQKLWNHNKKVRNRKLTIYFGSSPVVSSRRIKEVFITQTYTGEALDSLTELEFARWFVCDLSYHLKK